MRNPLKPPKASVKVQKRVRFPLDAQVGMAFIKADSHVSGTQSGQSESGPFAVDDYFL